MLSDVSLSPSVRARSDKIRRIEAFRETGIDAGHAIRGLRAFATRGEQAAQRYGGAQLQGQRFLPLGDLDRLPERGFRLRAIGAGRRLQRLALDAVQLRLPMALAGEQNVSLSSCSSWLYRA
jgi:hypothetical protein